MAIKILTKEAVVSDDLSWISSFAGCKDINLFLFKMLNIKDLSFNSRREGAFLVGAASLRTPPPQKKSGELPTLWRPRQNQGALLAANKIFCLIRQKLLVLFRLTEVA